MLSVNRHITTFRIIFLRLEYKFLKKNESLTGGTQCSHISIIIVNSQNTLFTHIQQLYFLFQVGRQEIHKCVTLENRCEDIVPFHMVLLERRFTFYVGNKEMWIFGIERIGEVVAIVN